MTPEEFVDMSRADSTPPARRSSGGATPSVMPSARVCLAAALVAAPTAAVAESVPMDGDRWDIVAQESKVVDHLGRRCLFLRGGLAQVRGSRFGDGVIAFDISFTPERGYMGAAWRIQDRANYEEFYVRPHQSGNPDANQYAPVWNGISAWQLYAGERYSTPTKYRFDGWTHVRIVVAGASAEVYIDDRDAPALVIDELKRGPGAGAVGLSVGNAAPAIYSNFSYEPMDRPPTLAGKPRPPERAPVGTVPSWRVSRAFDGASLDGKVKLAAAAKRSLTWTRLPVEGSGLANLARIQGVGEGHDTAFARFVVRSDRAQVKKLRFGFSDEVKVYFNDRLLYGGSDVYRSRDYRFLGTIGLYDEVYLPLVAGDNEVWLAVTEHFGGWGVQARFDDVDGIHIIE
jgi:hypothetical protein